MELPVILLLHKLYAHINIFEHIEEKYGQLEIKLSKITQKQHKKTRKIKYDINYFLYFKRNSLTLISIKYFCSFAAYVV